MNRLISRSIVVLAMLATTAVQATECAVEVSNAQEQARNQYVNGMSGLANNNYSMRPGSYSSMACLDGFMQGDMDVFFRPPALDDLLQQALAFACEQISGAMEGGGPGGQGGQAQVLDIMKSLSGGLSVPSAGGGSTSVNVADFLNISSPTASQGSSPIKNLFGGM